MHFYVPVRAGGGALTGLDKVHTARFAATPECAAFVLRAGGGDGDGDGAGAWELVLGLRDTAHLVHIDCAAPSSSSASSPSSSAYASASAPASFAQRSVSLNEAAWDTHVSFTPLALAPSPDRRHLLVATDQVREKEREREREKRERERN